jgi:hypothetical protein
VSRAATAKGTRRRTAIELAAIDRIARRSTPQLPARLRRRAVREYHRKITTGRA